MATGIIKDNSVIGLETESTEGTYVAPAGATSYIQPLADGWEFVPLRPNVERAVLTSSVGVATPIKGIKSCTASIPVELRGSGTEGAVPDFDLLVKGALGTSRAISANKTTKSSGNTGSVLQIEDADIGSFNVGDVILIKQTGGHHVCAITAKSSGTGTATITVNPAKATGSFADSVVISKSTTYYTASSGHSPLSASFYYGNEKRYAGLGMKVASMSVDNFSTGSLASLNFGLEGLTYTVADGAAPHTPTYDTAVPATVLNACLYVAGTEYRINTFGLSLANTLSFLTSTCSSTGRDKSRVTERVITGTINPFMDDTTTTLEDYLSAGTEFSLFISLGTPSATAGEYTMGSVVGIWLPQCVANEMKPSDLEGVLTHEFSFQATRGSAGTSEEMYMGFI
ncbi:MAG: hypothetical protein E6R04_07970 [Spirochaetes bacterium]|nr:MAG: hypothetical protein E6R04_07970 [Spirochaetota bacterium]